MKYPQLIIIDKIIIVETIMTTEPIIVNLGSNLGKKFFIIGIPLYP
jgi:hypothetical protein